jgi:hypothetical protein
MVDPSLENGFLGIWDKVSHVSTQIASLMESVMAFLMEVVHFNGITW